MPVPTATERQVLVAIAEERACDYMKVGRKVGISPQYADQLCCHLLKWGYVERFGRRYQLTETGREAAAKEMERQTQKSGKDKPTQEESLGRDRWLGGYRARTQKGNIFPEEGLVWQPYRGFGGSGRMKGRSLPELLRDTVYQCAFCAGEGQSPPGTKCAVCKGRGTVTILKPPAVKCAYCRGTGRKERRAHITCVVCKGKGIVRVKEPIQTCPACGGKGYATGDRLPCTLCRGKGVVTKKDLRQRRAKRCQVVPRWIS